jgi:hypothetical protein
MEIEKGSLVRVTHNCDTGGLWGMTGIVLQIEMINIHPNWTFAEKRPYAWVLLSLHKTLIPCASLEIVNEDRS